MSYRLPPPVAGIVQASSPSTPSVALPHYYQQTTSSILDSALVFTFIATVACLLLFSFARTRRTSIYSPRQFFVRDEHQADAFSLTFFGWIAPLLFLERNLERALRNQKSSLGAHHKSSVSEKEIGTTSNAPVSDQQHQLSDHDVVSTLKSRWESIRPSFLGRANVSNVQDGVKSNGFPVNASSASETSSHRPSTFQSDINTEAARDAIVAKVGLDHYLLVRFLKMLFTLSAVIAVTALVVLIPVYSIGQSGEDLLTTGEIMDEDGVEGPRILKLGGGWFASKRVEMLQIGNVTDNERLWAAVVIVAIFSGMYLQKKKGASTIIDLPKGKKTNTPSFTHVLAFVFIWVWSELMEFLKLRQAFLFRSASRYSSRVVLLQHLPPGLRSVAALKQAFANADGGVEYVYPVHDVTALDKAVKRRQVVLDRLEETEFRYMDAIARASTMVTTTTLSMRSRSWIGELVDKTKAFFGLEKTNTILGSSNGGQGNIGGVLSSNPEDEDYVGPLKMYQLQDVPKLSLTDLSNPASGSTPSPTPTGGITAVVSSSAGTSSSFTALKWFQKPRRPRHYAGIPLFSKRQDSIRYYRGELCRLNKLIAQGYAQQVQAMEQEQQQQVPQGQRNMAQVSNQTRGLEDIDSLDNVSVAQNDSKASIKPLSSAFLLMRTRAGAKMAASSTLVPDLDIHSRVLGISPRDIEWHVLGQTQSSATCLFKKGIILGIGFLFLVGCGLVVAAISSLAVDHGWERVLAQDAMVSAPSAIYWRQGILTPILLTVVMLGGSWILNGTTIKKITQMLTLFTNVRKYLKPFFFLLLLIIELCQYWGQVSKTQEELLMQQYYFLFLVRHRLAEKIDSTTLECCI